MTTKRITRFFCSLVLYSLFFFGIYSLLRLCTDTNQPPAILPDIPEPVTPHNSIVVTDTFRIEVDRNYRLRQKPESCPNELDEKMVDLILHGMFDQEGDLRETFVLDSTLVDPEGLDMSVFGVPRKTIYLAISGLALTYYTLWKEEDGVKGIQLLIIRTGLYQELHTSYIQKNMKRSVTLSPTEINCLF